MKIIWIGQAGLYMEIGGVKIMIDPYLSDSVGKKDPKKSRRLPVDESIFDLEPDVMIFTHDHLDHYDPETAPIFLQKTHPMTVLSPTSCWEKARQFGGAHNYVVFERGTQWTQGGTCFAAVRAVHSDPYAIGVIIRGEGKCLYVTGDTLYSTRVLEDLPKDIDAVFLPINGVGNNMNMVDAARLAKDCGAKRAVPLHFGIFDDLDPAGFAFEPKTIPEIYKEITLGEMQ